MDRRQPETCEVGSGKRWLRRFSGDRSGAAAVEFALVATPFLFFIFGIFQVAIYHFSTQALDYATRTASRQIMTGQIKSTGMTADQFKTTVLCPALVIPLDCSKIAVSVSKVAKTSDKLSKTGIYAFMNNSATALLPPNLDTSTGTFCTGSGSDYLFIDVTYRFQSYMNFSGSGTDSNGQNDFWILRSTNFIYNEPFSTSSGC